MDYLKYLAFRDEHLLVFSPRYTHANIARFVGRLVDSAGFFSANASGGGKFFGESVSLRLTADKSLTMAGREWFEGEKERTLMFSTDPALLDKIGARAIQPAPFVQGENCQFPSSGRWPKATLELVFLP